MRKQRLKVGDVCWWSGPRTPILVEITGAVRFTRRLVWVAVIASSNAYVQPDGREWLIKKDYLNRINSPRDI